MDEGRSGATTVPLLLTAAVKQMNGETTIHILGKFYVSKALLEEELKFIGEGHDVEQREARRRQVFSRLIAASHK